MTFGEIANNLEKAGILKSYDFGMPMDWVYRVIDKTGHNPSGHIVWSYDKGYMGAPFAITLFGWQLLRIIGEPMFYN